MIARAAGLYKTYTQAGTEIPVLRGAELEVADGETVAILGQSGSGKSTLLTLLAGLDRPTSGTVSLAGTDLGSLSEADLAVFRARNLGIVFQQFHLMSHLTALENVSLPLDISRAKDAEARAREALERVGLSHRLGHLPSQMSGGEKQRVAIARAWVIRPKLLLADEPSGSLDTRTGAEVMDLLFEQVKSAKADRSLAMAMILVTHNEELAARCDRALRLIDGKLV